MFSKVNTFGLSGVKGFSVTVETNISKGIPVFDIVGLGNEAVRESRKRVRAAVENQGFKFPQGKITLNLAPADRRKQGTYLDLAVAIGILAASGLSVSRNLDDFAVVGELSLNGDVRGVRGIIPMIVYGISQGIKKFIIPYDNARELSEEAFSDKAEIYPVNSINEAISVLKGQATVSDFYVKNDYFDDETEICDFSSIIGQKAAKRALEIAVSGNHNILMIGAAGCGKTLMAKAVRDIMVPMSFEEAFETSQIYSAAGINDRGMTRKRPFRAVHSCVTKAALSGGGRPFEIGEVSLAHNGVLFIDELSEVNVNAIDALRQPLEEKIVRVNYCGMKEIIPANFMLVAASNPCPCGNLYERDTPCNCSPSAIKRYNGRISAPILDRIDIQIPVRKIKAAQLDGHDGDTSEVIRQRVFNTRSIQNERYKQEKFNTNGELSRNNVNKYCRLNTNCRKLLDKAVDTMGISLRGYEKVVKVARTIADMDVRENIEEGDIAEALQYRFFDRREVAA